jgi:hypothetical protein
VWRRQPHHRSRGVPVPDTGRRGTPRIDRIH